MGILHVQQQRHINTHCGAGECTHHDGDAVGLHAEQVVHKRLIRPRVVHQGRQINVPVQEDQHWQIGFD